VNGAYAARHPMIPISASAGISSARTVILPSVTHFVSYQDPAVFNELVPDFLGEH